jgi:hypothetical protein
MPASLARHDCRALANINARGGLACDYSTLLIFAVHEYGTDFEKAQLNRARPAQHSQSQPCHVCRRSATCRENTGAEASRAETAD